jgi:GntR family transcriptional regulator/MocR family aminotransferase
MTRPVIGTKRVPTLMSLDADTGEPLYRQLRLALTTAIETGQFLAGELLPSSRALAAELGLSRNTVNTAYQEMVAEGFLESVDRVGYVVNRDLRVRLSAVDDIDSANPSEIDWDSRLNRFESPVGEVSKPVNWKEYEYPFVVGQPSADSFPIRGWNRAMRNALLDEHQGPSLHDLVDTDDPLLIEQIRRTILPSRGINASASQILVTLGSQHGLHLIATALLGSESRVGVEEPGYPDARQIFGRQGAELAPMAIDDHGLIVPEVLDPDVDLVFVTPSHQYPTNVTMAVGRRRQLLDQAEAEDFLVIEDDYDSAFRCQGRPTPALKAADDSGRVIYVGSFSKFLAPGLRLGFIVAEAPLIEHLRNLRRYMLRHPPGIIQRSVALMMESGDYVRALRRRRKALKQKWETITAAIADHFPWETEFTTGGVSVWVEGPEWLDGVDLAMRALDAGIVIESGDVCFLELPAPKNFFKLGFSGIDHDLIEPGIARLAGLLA